MTAAAADVWADLDEPGDKLARLLRDMVVNYENRRDRSQQSAANIMGPSGIGNPCARCLARQVLGRPAVRDFDDPWCAIIGTAVHAWLAEAAAQQNIDGPVLRWLYERKVHPEPELLRKGGELDLYSVPLRTVVDHKIVGKATLSKVKHNGPGLQYRRQAHIYGRGLAREGWPVERVAVAFWHRGGRLRDLYVWTEPYDPAIAEQAFDRYRTIRDLAIQLGPAVLPSLPADPDCWDCSGRDVTPEELQP